MGRPGLGWIVGLPVVVFFFLRVSHQLLMTGRRITIHSSWTITQPLCTFMILPDNVIDGLEILTAILVLVDVFNYPSKRYQTEF